MSVLFITHDMGAVANLCHNVKVMYLGQVVEEASTEELFQNPLHPYTQGLLSCIPHLGVKKGEPLPVIEGSVLRYLKYRRVVISVPDVRCRSELHGT